MKNILILLLTVFTFSVQAQEKMQLNLNEVVAKKAAAKKAQAKIPAFEGIVKIADNREIGFTGDYLIKDKKVASEMPFDKKEKINRILDNAEYTIITLKKKKGKKLALKSRRIFNADQRMPVEIKVKVSEQTKKIGGYECVRVVADDTFTKLEAWVAKDLNIRFQDLLHTGNGLELINKINAEVPGMIMELKGTDLAKRTTYMMAVSVEAKTIKDKAFEIPKGYELVDNTRTPGRARSVPSASSFKGVTDRAYEIQKKVREGKMKPAGDAAPAKAAPAAAEPKKEE